MSRIVTILSLTFCLSNAINIIPDKYMQSGYGDCGTTVTGLTNAYVRSHVGAYQLGTLIKYKNDENCSLSYNAGNGNRILLKFLEFDLQPEVNNACPDWLSVYEAGQSSPELKFCGASTSAYESTGQSVRLEFYTDHVIQGKGFQILVSSFRVGLHNCQSDEFRCDNTRCIPQRHVCDTVNHCVDGTDEDDVKAKCTTWDKVTGRVFRLGEHTLLAIIIISCVVLSTIILSVVIYKMWCKKKRNRVGLVVVEEPTKDTPKPRSESSQGPKKAWKKKN